MGDLIVYGVCHLRSLVVTVAGVGWFSSLVVYDLDCLWIWLHAADLLVLFGWWCAY